MKKPLYHTIAQAALWSLPLISVFILLKIYWQTHVSPNPSKEAAIIAEEYLTLETEILRLVANKELATHLLTDAFTYDAFSSLCSLPFGLAVMQPDSTSFWTSNAIMPVQAQTDSNDVPLFITESNGSYILYQHTFSDGITSVAFLPLRTEYGINNNYLNEVSVPGIQIPDYFEATSRGQSGSFAILTQSGKPVFYLTLVQTENQVRSPPGWIWIPAFLAFMGGLFGVRQVFLFYLKHKQKSKALFWIFTSTAAIYMVFRIVFTHYLSIAELFNPGIYASTWIADNVGDLFLRTSLILFLVNQVFGRLNWPESSSKLVIQTFLLVAVAWYTQHVMESLVTDSSIDLNIRALFEMDAYTIVGFICLASLCLATALLAKSLWSNPKPLHLKVAIFLIPAVLFIAIDGLVFTSMNQSFILFMVVLVPLIVWSSRVQTPIMHLLSNMTWLLFFSFLISYVMNQALYEKSEESKQLYAYKKAVEKDPLAEYLFTEQQVEIFRLLNAHLARQIDDDQPVKQGIINQLKQELQTNYYKKYSSELYFFKEDSLIASSGELENASLYFFIDAIENNGAYTAAENLYFINDYTGNYYYLAELNTGTLEEKITVYIRLIPRRFNSQSLYPELLIDDELRLPDELERLDYAIYYNNNLIERKGSFSYPVMDVFYVEKGSETADVSMNGYDHFVYAPSDVKKVVVSEPDMEFKLAVSYFSFVFLLLVIYYGVLLGGTLLLKTLTGERESASVLETSLQNKVQFSIVSLVVFTFLVLGISTIIYINAQYNRENEDKLLEKIEAVQTSIDHILDESRRTIENRSAPLNGIKRVSNRIAELSEVHDMDINMYSRKGMLLHSSQPDIFDKGLISKRMNPLAYFKMTCEKETWFIHHEQIGRLSFLSAYVPVLDNEGEVYFYINLPYFATEKDLQEEISAFLVTLVNVYVILLLLSAVIALVVSRNITAPLSLIAGTFKNVQLGKTNEPVNWPHDDEIGLLVKEYNSMLNELDKSARMLAISERESAWRDMAKQVAHEIKNPLTPMRLSIQHLQRAMNSGHPDIEELTKKVTGTLLEQIDNLSFIASEFSHFAVMPKAVNEVINIVALIENVAGLFNDTEEVKVVFQEVVDPVYIFADRNQILRVFNNLLKNAQQAIPEDRDGLITISMELKSDRLIIRVADNGVGIPEELRDKVFVPNFTTKGSGMGIGLALSKNIIESTGGYIWFESLVNQGTTFFIEFPVYVHQDHL